MTTQESYVKLTINGDGKVQPELFISGELDSDVVAGKLRNLCDVLESKTYGFRVVKNEATFEVKQMSGWKQITVRGSDVELVKAKFNELSNMSDEELEKLVK